MAEKFAEFSPNVFAILFKWENYGDPDNILR